MQKKTAVKQFEVRLKIVQTHIVELLVEAANKKDAKAKALCWKGELLDDYKEDQQDSVCKVEEVGR